jgi:hypothetical protein
MKYCKTVKQFLLYSFKNFLVSKNKMTIFLRQEKCIANTNFIWFIIERTEVSFARKCTRYACRIIQLIEFFCLWQTEKKGKYNLKFGTWFRINNIFLTTKRAIFLDVKVFCSKLSNWIIFQICFNSNKN